MLEMSPTESQIADHQYETCVKSKLGPVHCIRRSHTNAYNCHGLTFAMRRAFVDLNRNGLEQVLADDGFSEVALPNVMPGDIVVYYDEGEPEHTAVVVWTEEQHPVIRCPWVISKLGPGPEVVHRYNYSPYTGIPVFYREGAL
jgi:hypothetical protein